jgi:hypothetical protein
LLGWFQTVSLPLGHHKTMIIRQASQSLVYLPGHDPDRVAGFTISVGWPSTSVMATQ